jgi:hypothetical protein
VVLTSIGGKPGSRWRSAVQKGQCVIYPPSRDSVRDVPDTRIDSKSGRPHRLGNKRAWIAEREQVTLFGSRTRISPGSWTSSYYGVGGSTEERRGG